MRLGRLIRCVLWAACLVLLMQSQASLAVNRIFLLDTSKSMKAEGLFDKIKSKLQRDYIQPMVAGEHVAVLGFDEEVVLAVDQQALNESDKERIQRAVEGLQADGRWTWMKEALSLTAEQARSMRARYPQDELLVYVMTDGVNDPPPDHLEDSADFDELLRHYFPDFEKEGANVYVRVFNAKEDVDLGDQPFNWQVVQPGVENPFPAEILLGPVGFNFGDIQQDDLPQQRTGTLNVLQIVGDASGQYVGLSCELGPGRPLTVSPSHFQVEVVGQQVAVTLSLPQDLDTLDYLANMYTSSTGANVRPATVPVAFRIVGRKTFHIDLPVWLQVLLGVVLALLALYLLMIFGHTKRLRVRVDGDDETYSVTARHVRRTSLEDAQLPDRSVFLSSVPWDITGVLMESTQGERTEVDLGVPVRYECPDGRSVTVTFDEDTTLAYGDSDDDVSHANEDPDAPFREREDD